MGDAVGDGVKPFSDSNCLNSSDSKIVQDFDRGLPPGKRGPVFSPIGIIYGSNVKPCIKAISEIEEIYDEYMTRKSNSVDITLVIRFVDILKKYRLNTPDWIFQNLENCRLTGHNLEFFKDSIDFFCTGSRPMQIETRLCLMEFYEDLQSLPPLKREPNTLKKLYDTKTRKFAPYGFVSTWVSHDGGFPDMLKTYHTLFSRVNRKV